MNVANPEVDAFFNLEVTLMEHVAARIVDAMRLHELIKLPDDISTAKLGFAGQRTECLKAIAGKTYRDLAPVVNDVAESCLEGIASWALPVMRRHAEAGRSIRILSTTTPSIFVRPCANALSSVLPTETKVRGDGLPLVQYSKVYTGETAPLLKGKFMAEKKARGHRIAFVADSFASAQPAFDAAEHHLRVNFSPRQKVYASDHIGWNSSKSQIIHAQAAGTTDVISFDISYPHKEEEFVDWVTYKDPEVSGQ